MTIEEINERVAKIRESSWDDEVAHGMEDSLREDFIKYVATLDIPLAAKAKSVLETSEMKFNRWCA